MKKLTWIPPLALFGGLAGIAVWLLRWRLLSTGVDHKGLLVRGNPLSIVSWVLTAAVAALVAAALWKHRKETFALRAAPGSEALRIPAMLIAAVSLWGGEANLVEKAAAAAALLAAVAALMRLVLRKKQLSPAVADIPAVLFWMLLLICRYQGWSAETEIQRYAFTLLATVCLLFATFARSSVELGLGKHRLFLGAGLLGVFFAFGAAADPGFAGIFLPMGVWLMLQLDTVTEAA